MITLEEFRTGQYRVPAPDVDDLPPCCFTCVYLAFKEFSVGEGLYYYFCGYGWQDRIRQAAPPCLEIPA